GAVGVLPQEGGFAGAVEIVGCRGIGGLLSGAEIELGSADREETGLGAETGAAIADGGVGRRVAAISIAVDDDRPTRLAGHTLAEDLVGAVDTRRRRVRCRVVGNGAKVIVDPVRIVEDEPVEAARRKTGLHRSAERMLKAVDAEQRVAFAAEPVRPVGLAGR